MNHAFCELYCHQNQQRIQNTVCASIDVLVEVNENSLSGLDFEGQTLSCIILKFVFPKRFLCYLLISV